MLLLVNNVHEETSQRVKTDVNFDSARAVCNLHSCYMRMHQFSQSDTRNYFMYIIAVVSRMAH